MKHSVWMRVCCLVLCVWWFSLLSAPAFASSLIGSRVGAPREAGQHAIAGGLVANVMAANDAGWDARFVAESVLDVTAVTVSWITVTAAGVVSLRIETDDGTGKPSGTLYDANATSVGLVPASGKQTYTFAVAPTTGLTIGTMYHVLIITTTLGTTMNLGSHLAMTVPATAPVGVLTTATGSTRNTFAVVSNAVPAMILTRTGGGLTSFEILAHPFLTTVSSTTTVTTSAVAAKIVTQGTLSVTAYILDNIIVTGTPAGDLRIRLFDSNDAVVSGSTVTVDKDTIVNGRGIKVPIGTAISIVAGTYRLVFDCASCANSSNCYTFKSATALDANAVPNATLSTIADVTASPPLTWTDTSTVMVPAALIINGITLPAAIKGAGGIIGG